MAASSVHIKIPHSVIVKAPGLLPMLYKVSELSTDLSIPDRTLRDWLEAGAPHTRDGSGHLWVNGQEFKQWIDTSRKQKASKIKLASGEAYCLHCKHPVQLVDPVRTHIKGRLYHIQGTCPDCGNRINRGDSDDRP